jgi:hypothetical protein
MLELAFSFSFEIGISPCSDHGDASQRRVELPDVHGGQGRRQRPDLLQEAHVDPTALEELNSALVRQLLIERAHIRVVRGRPQRVEERLLMSVLRSVAAVHGPCLWHEPMRRAENGLVVDFLLNPWDRKTGFGEYRCFPWLSALDS